MTTILIRCDASLSIGSGHITRCRTLARVLKQRGVAITFMCRKQSGDLISLLDKEFDVLDLPEHPQAFCEGLEGRDLYGAWLGCTQDQDAEDCLKSLAQAGISSASWLVVDHYGLDAAWESKMLSGLNKESSTSLFAIDDLADRLHQADLLLDQNYFGCITQERYSGLVPDHCRQLLGPHYSLLGPEYSYLHSLVPLRQELKRVLVFFGGVDSMNLTSLALIALMAPEFEGLSVDVVLGQQSTHRNEVEELVKRRPFTKLHFPLPSLAGLMTRCDLALGAGGATTWERACLALPSLVVAIAENQLPLASALHAEGELQLIGSAPSIGVEQIKNAIQKVCEEGWPRSSGQTLTDGWGSQRLSSALLGLRRPLSLRTALSSDESLLFRWANDPQVRSNSCSPATIALADHRTWYQSGLEDPNRLLLIACDAQGCPIGQIRFDRESAPYAGRIDQARISLSLDRCVRGQGLATEIVMLGLEAMQRVWGSAVGVQAEIFAKNIPSQATFAKAGFVMDENIPPIASSDDYLTVWHWKSAQ